MCNLDFYSIHGKDATDIYRIWKVYPDIPYQKLCEDRAYFLEILWQVKHMEDDYAKQL